MPFRIITWFFLPWVNHHQKVKHDRATSRSPPHPNSALSDERILSKACCRVFMTLNVLFLVTFTLLSFPLNELDDLWTKSVESLGWYNPVWEKLPLFRPRLETSCHMSRCELEFCWTRLPSDEPVRAGWVLHDGEVGWLVRHTGQWLLTLRLPPRCSCGRKGLCVCVCIDIPFSSCLQSFPALGSFPKSPFFTSGGHSIGVSASASVLSMNIHGWFCLGLTVLISLQSKGLSRVFSSNTNQKHQFFCVCLLYGPTLTTVYDYLKNHSFDYMDLCWQSNSSAF